MLSNTMAAIIGTWLPESGYEADGAEFEHYTDEFDPVSGTGIFYIWVRCLSKRPDGRHSKRAAHPARRARAFG